MFEFIKKLFGLSKPEDIAKVETIIETAKPVVKRVKKIADVNKDGKLDGNDVKEVKKRVYRKVKDKVDANKDGEISAVEVIAEMNTILDIVDKPVKKPRTKKAPVEAPVEAPVAESITEKPALATIPRKPSKGKKTKKRSK